MKSSRSQFEISQDPYLHESILDMNWSSKVYRHLQESCKYMKSIGIKHIIIHDSKRIWDFTAWKMLH